MFLAGCPSQSARINSFRGGLSTHTMVPHHCRYYQVELADPDGLGTGYTMYVVASSLASPYVPHTFCCIGSSFLCVESSRAFADQHNCSVHTLRYGSHILYSSLQEMIEALTGPMDQGSTTDEIACALRSPQLKLPAYTDMSARSAGASPILGHFFDRRLAP